MNRTNRSKWIRKANSLRVNSLLKWYIFIVHMQEAAHNSNNRWSSVFFSFHIVLERVKYWFEWTKVKIDVLVMYCFDWIPNDNTKSVGHWMERWNYYSVNDNKIKDQQWLSDDKIVRNIFWIILTIYMMFSIERMAVKLL